MTAQQSTIVKQVATRMTAAGFANEPHGAEAEKKTAFSDTVEVWQIHHLTKNLKAQYEPVYAMVILNGQSPIPAWHVVDFRVGDDIYSRGTNP